MRGREAAVAWVVGVSGTTGGVAGVDVSTSGVAPWLAVAELWAAARGDLFFFGDELEEALLKLGPVG